MTSLRILHYLRRRLTLLDAIKDLLKQYIKEESVSKVTALQNYLQNEHSITVEHS